MAVAQHIEKLLEWHSPPVGYPDFATDGLLVYSVTVRKQYRIDVRGFMIWDVLNQYVDVFEASMRIGNETDDLKDYVLKFGRRGSEFRRIKYGEGRVPLIKELEDGRGWEWATQFKKGEERS